MPRPPAAVRSPAGSPWCRALADAARPAMGRGRGRLARRQTRCREGLSDEHERAGCLRSARSWRNRPATAATSSALRQNDCWTSNSDSPVGRFSAPMKRLAKDSVTPFGQSKPLIYLGRARPESLPALAPHRAGDGLTKVYRVNLLERYDYPGVKPRLARARPHRPHQRRRCVIRRWPRPRSGAGAARLPAAVCSARAAHARIRSTVRQPGGGAGRMRPAGRR